jgi:invasion protein IalB
MNIQQIIRSGVIAGTASAVLVAGAAWAQEAAARPTPTLTKQIGDWTVQCFAEGGTTNCRMNEILVNKKTNIRVLSVTVLYLPEQKRSLIEALVPLNVALQSGVSVKAAPFDSGVLQYNICVAQGCQTLFPAVDDTIKSLSSATSGSVQIVDYSTGKKISIAFPLNGFSEAYQTIVSSSHGGPAAPAAN